MATDEMRELKHWLGGHSGQENLGMYSAMAVFDAFNCFLTELLLVIVLSFLSSLPFLLPSNLTISPLRLPYWGLLVLKHD